VGPGGPSRERAAVSHGDWAAAKEEVSKKNKRENDKTYQKKNPPIPVLGVGIMNGWRETYLTPTRYPDGY